MLWRALDGQSKDADRFSGSNTHTRLGGGGPCCAVDLVDQTVDAGRPFGIERAVETASCGFVGALVRMAVRGCPQLGVVTSWDTPFEDGGRGIFGNVPFVICGSSGVSQSF